MDDRILLDVVNVSKSYEGNAVLKDINFKLKKGEILGLVGENGAGKSTLMNIIFGMGVIADTGGYNGEIYLDGKKIDFKNTTDALKAGVGMVHQEFSLIPGFTVTENIMLNMEKTNKSVLSTVFGKKLETIDNKTNLKLTGNSLDTLGVDIDPNEYVSEMPVGHKQFIEIAREITRENVKLLIMDEPTAVLTESEADNLIKSLKRLSDLGIGIIFISHRLREITELCDKIVVLRDGIVVVETPTRGVSIQQIASWMVGRDLSSGSRSVNLKEKSDETIMEIKNLWVDMPGEIIRNVNLDVKKGEIIGIAGLAGQGKLGIPNGIMGIYPSGGEVTFKGETLDISDTLSSLQKRIAFVSEDRRGVGLLLDEPIYWNIAFNAMQVQNKYLKNIMGIKFRDEAAMKKLADEYIDELEIRTTGNDQFARNLSGGNQQKVCLAKAFAMEPELLFVSEPTRGIDIGAKNLVLESLLKANREKGTTIVMVSSELEELRSVSDRIAVVCEGEVTGILPPDASAENFGLLMAGEKVEEVNA